MNTTKLTRFLSYLTVVVFVLVPFQALLTTWIGANFGHIDLFRIWKELLLVLLTGGSLCIVYKDKKLKQWLVKSPLVGMILVFALLQLGLGVWALQTGKVNAPALVYGLIINLRYLLFFLICLVLAAKSDWLNKNWKTFVLIPAAVVMAFALMQHFILPNNFLTHFGYGPKTIPAYQAVDHKPQYVRLQSTLRGPNPLGAYLLLVIISAAAYFITNKKQRRQLSLLISAAVIALYFTYSRSAWIGTFVGCVLVIYWLAQTKKARQWLIVGSVSLMLVMVAAVSIWHSNGVLENTLFHTSRTSRSAESSNAVRTEAMLDGAKSVLRQPLGGGPGTAGPASFRNLHSPRIAENYFIQVGQEIGIMGLVIFIVINLYVARELWRGDGYLTKVVLAALIGLTIVNLLSHAWADDTLAYVFWGLAGITLAPTVILNPDATSPLLTTRLLAVRKGK